MPEYSPTGQRRSEDIRQEPQKVYINSWIKDWQMKLLQRTGRRMEQKKMP
jgi:hypothetical protein